MIQFSTKHEKFEIKIQFLKFFKIIGKWWRMTKFWSKNEKSEITLSLRQNFLGPRYRCLRGNLWLYYREKVRNFRLSNVLILNLPSVMLSQYKPVFINLIQYIKCFLGLQVRSSDRYPISSNLRGLPDTEPPKNQIIYASKEELSELILKNNFSIATKFPSPSPFTFL